MIAPFFALTKKTPSPKRCWEMRANRSCSHPHNNRETRMFHLTASPAPKQCWEVRLIRYRTPKYHLLHTCLFRTVHTIPTVEWCARYDNRIQRQPTTNTPKDQKHHRVTRGSKLAGLDDCSRDSLASSTFERLLLWEVPPCNFNATWWYHRWLHYDATTSLPHHWWRHYISTVKIYKIVRPLSAPGPLAPPHVYFKVFMFMILF